MQQCMCTFYSGIKVASAPFHAWLGVVRNSSILYFMFVHPSIITTCTNENAWPWSHFWYLQWAHNPSYLSCSIGYWSTEWMTDRSCICSFALPNPETSFNMRFIQALYIRILGAGKCLFFDYQVDFCSGKLVKGCHS